MPTCNGIQDWRMSGLQRGLAPKVRHNNVSNAINQNKCQSTFLFLRMHHRIPWSLKVYMAEPDASS